MRKTEGKQVRQGARTLALVGILLGMLPDCASAQGWPAWADEVFGRRPGFHQRSPQLQESPPIAPRAEPKSTPRGGITDFADGGARPNIAAVPPPIVAFPHDFPADSIVIDTGRRKLYYVLAENRAFEYSISVGREGFNWTGKEEVSRKQAWPDWYPPAEMRERDPSLPEKMTGGIKNPLGAIALYLGNTLYRIHGTNDAKSIGQAASSGCFRLLNSAVLHLASITAIGTPVSVVESLPMRQEISRASQVSDPPENAPSDPARPEPRTFPNYQSLREGTLLAR